MPGEVRGRFAQPAPVAETPDAAAVPPAVTAGRARRGWSIAGSIAVAVLVAVAVPVAVQIGRTDRSPVATGAGSSTRSSAPVGTPGTAALPVVSIDTAALVKAIAAANVDFDGRQVDVRAGTCDNLNPPTSDVCGHATPIPAAVRQAILGMLPSDRDIRFVAGPATSPPGSRHLLFVTLGPAEISGTHAKVFVQSWCGFDCVRGEGLVLTFEHGQWQVTGGYGGYIS